MDTVSHVCVGVVLGRRATCLFDRVVDCNVSYVLGVQQVIVCVCGCVCNISSGVASVSANGSVSSCKSDNVEGTDVEGAAGG